MNLIFNIQLPSCLTMNSKKTITFGKISANLDKLTPEAYIETSSSGFGTFGKKREENNVKKMDEIRPEDEEETRSIQKLMGITGFGKKAKSFDVQEMMENITKTINSNKASTIEQEKSDEVAESKKDEVNDDDDFIGPSIPSSLPVTSEATEDSKKDALVRIFCSILIFQNFYINFLEFLYNFINF